MRSPTEPENEQREPAARTTAPTATATIAPVLQPPPELADDAGPDGPNAARALSSARSGFGRSRPQRFGCVRSTLVSTRVRRAVAPWR